MDFGLGPGLAGFEARGPFRTVQKHVEYCRTYSLRGFINLQQSPWQSKPPVTQLFLVPRPASVCVFVSLRLCCSAGCSSCVLCAACLSCVARESSEVHPLARAGVSGKLISYGLFVCACSSPATIAWCRVLACSSLFWTSVSYDVLWLCCVLCLRTDFRARSSV